MLLFGIECGIAIGFRAGALDEGFQRLSPPAIAMEVGIFANGRW
jgi:hypothetical protein